MSSIDPEIVIYEIKTYPDANPVNAFIQVTHVKRLLSSSKSRNFLKPTLFIWWLSQTRFLILSRSTRNKALFVYELIIGISTKLVPKTTFLPPSLIKLSTIAPEVKSSLSWMVSPGIFKSTLFLRINIRLLLFVLGVLLPIGNSLSVSRTLAPLFNALCLMLSMISRDDLLAHSMCQVDHPTHLRAIFVRCRFYRIRLNPHKCVFCVESGCLLGFIVSHQGIQVDPLKVEVILNLPPPSTLRQLQILQGKENFLRRFIPNYAEITRGFTWLLKKDSEFIWDTIANNAFEALKVSLTRAPLIFPPDYNRDYFLYLVSLDYTIGMVLVQEDDSNDEYVIYYLSRNLMPTEIKYLHVEKLALAVVQAVQHFQHYILSRKTTMISHCNPMQHILTRQLLGGKYSKWIVILQEFDLEFECAKSKNSLVFAELICDFPHSDMENVATDSLPDESLFLISTDDLWYGDIIIYIQTQTF
jgi:hypothetical protein